MILPEKLHKQVTAVWGERGARWLEGLPDLLEDILERWSLTLEAPLPDLGYHYLAYVRTSRGRGAVLKLGVPDRELGTEIRFLQAADGDPVVRLLQADPGRGALLLDRVRPGRPLTTLEDDQEAARIGARLIRKVPLPVPAEHDYPSLSDWIQAFSRLRARFEGGSGPLPDWVLARAEGLYADLTAQGPEPRLLHGDLHHANILWDQEDGWVVIDPKGVIADPAYEAARFQHNPIPTVLSQDRPVEFVRRRLLILEEVLGFERRRLLGWAYVDAVLSACWSLEEGAAGWKTMLAWIEVYEELLEGLPQI
jgi:streptomycin 6-kinase